MRHSASQILLSAGIFLGLSLIASGGNAQIILSASNNTGLSRLPERAHFAVVRLGFAAVGDSDQLTFFASDSACSLNAGNGDGGSQVKSFDGGCWLAHLPS